MGLQVHFFAFLLLGLSVPRAGAMYEWMPPASVCDSVHSYTPDPYQGVPPPMPSLPNQYTMNIQANILQKGWSSDVVEHYDGPNNQASVFLTFNGTTTQTIFNYLTKEKYDIFPDGTCKTRSGGFGDHFGFFKMDRNHRPIKATVYEMFHMGPQQNFTYVGNTWVRGIKVNHWTSCQEWADFGAKFQLDYYFSHDDYQTAWGTGQIPIRAVVNGSAGNQDQNRQHMFGRHKFEHIYDFTSFDVGPIKDQTVFHVPHDVVCMGRKDYKSLPNIPNNFQMNMEMSCPMMGSNIPFQHSLRYDWDHHMVETYMNIPSPQGDMDEIKKKMMEHHANGGTQADFSKLKNMGKMVMRAMSTIDDHNSGLRYVTEKANNTCRVTPMPEGKNAKPMDHGKSLFDMHTGQKAGNSPFTYQGRSTFRNIPVDVWGIDSDGMIQKVFFLADDVEPTIMKGQDDTSYPNHNYPSKPNGPGQNGGPTARPSGPGQNGRPTAWPKNPGQNGGPTAWPKNPGQNGKPTSRPSGPGQNGRPTVPGQNGRPTGRPTVPGQTGRPTGRPNGVRPTIGTNGRRSTGMPNNNRQKRQANPTDAPKTSRGPVARGGPMGNLQDMVQAAKEKAMGKSSPTNTPGSSGWMNHANTNSNNTSGQGNKFQDMMEAYKKRKEEQRQQGGSADSNAMGKSGGMMKHKVPFPVLVGMVFRNRTAISARSMPTFFQEVMQPELISWKEKMAKQYMANANKQMTEGSKILDKHAMMDQMHSQMMRHAGEMDMHVFQFQPLHTDESMFQVSQCYEPEQTSHVLLHVDTPFKTSVLNNKAAFSIAMRKGIAEAMGVSHIHISNLKPEPHIDAEKKIDATYVSFSLLGAPPVKAPKIKPPSISEAKRKLVRAIKNGISFKVNYPTHTKSFLVDKSHYSVDRRIFSIPSGSSAANVQHHDTSGDSDSSDYSPASVVGIAIATLLLGFIMAVTVVVILYKRKHPEEPVIPYKMTKT